MKKVHISVKPDSPGRRFWLFMSSAELWEWIVACRTDPTTVTSGVPTNAYEITLRPGSFLEAEWRGCEIMRDGDLWRHLNLIRVGESHPSQNASGNVVTLHMGWTIDTVFPMREYEDDNIEVFRIDGYEGESELDLEQLFKEKGMDP